MNKIRLKKVTLCCFLFLTALTTGCQDWEYVQEVEAEVIAKEFVEKHNRIITKYKNADNTREGVTNEIENLEVNRVTLEYNGTVTTVNNKKLHDSKKLGDIVKMDLYESGGFKKLKLPE